ncbi:MAG TPA: AMP-binding protein [Amycolatopsis sp.]|nr:AMP-binding protein [Amycolatopsis sp.]
MRAPDAETLPAQIISGAAENAGTELVFASEGRTFETSLGELVADAERIAGALEGLGIGSGDVVAVQLPGSYENAVVQTAVALRGAVLLPIVLIYGPRELGFILRQSRAVALFIPDTNRNRDHTEVARKLPELPDLRTVVVVGEHVPDGMVPFADLAGRLARPHTVPRPDPDARAMLVYTSGTTAEPKGVRHSHRSLLAEVFSLAPDRDVVARRRDLGLFPPGHVAGLLSLLKIVLLGIPTVVMEVWEPALAAKLADKYGVTNAVGAPVQLAGLLDERDRGTASLATLTEFMTGAANVSPALIERAQQAGISAYRTYGSSEHPTITTSTVADPLVKRATTDGRVIEGCEIRIVDDEGRDVPEGEIVSRGPELFLGYTDPDLNRTAFLPGGWFRTGDVGRLDADGYLTITDRKKDIIIRGGENISSKEVEDVLAEHAAVAQVAVVGMRDERLGERVCAFVVLRQGRTLTLDDVRAHFVAAGVARQKTPERVVVTGELPRTPAGKVQKFALRKQLEIAG